VKHANFFPLTVAFSLAACHDATAPEPESPAGTTTVQASPQIAIVDSSDVWVAMALEDAAERLASGIADDATRTSLNSALNSLAVELSRGQGAPAPTESANSHYAAARATLARLLALGDEGLAPELDAIGLVLDQAERFVARR
jgi:hypothetical protein